MPLDITNEVLTGIRLAVLARSMFALRPGNVVLTTRENWPKVMQSRSQPADFPCVLIFAAGDDAATTPMRPFGISTGDVDYPKRFIIKVEVRVVFDKLSDAAELPGEAEVSAGLMQTDRTLVGGVARAAPLEWRRTRTVGPFNNVQRTIVIWTASVECRPYYSALTS